MPSPKSDLDFLFNGAPRHDLRLGYGSNLLPTRAQIQSMFPFVRGRPFWGSRIFVSTPTAFAGVKSPGRMGSQIARRSPCPLTWTAPKMSCDHLSGGGFPQNPGGRKKRRRGFPFGSGEDSLFLARALGPKASLNWVGPGLTVRSKKHNAC